MTNYADVPAANALHAESETVQQALDILAAGGTMVQFTVAPSDTGTGVLPAAIAAPPGTVSAALIADLQAWLTQRQSDLGSQLATLGVT